MTARREFGHIYRRGAIYWVRYRLGGRTYRESTRSGSAGAAEQLLARRAAELGLGRFIAPDVTRTTFEDLARLITDDYAVQGHRSATKLSGLLRRLRAAFGGRRAIAITADRIRAYERARLEAGAARATVNGELATLRRMFRLGIEQQRLTTMPVIRTPDPHNARTGFVAEAEFRALLAELPDDLRAPIAFSYHTGWRLRSEVFPLTWANVDFVSGTVRLAPGTAKNREGRTFPFDVLPQLADLLHAQRARTTKLERDMECLVSLVFHRDGQPIRDVSAAWRSACQRAGCPGMLAHDLRRSAARNLIRAGVPQHVVMKLCGWETDAMFRRYAIVDEADLRSGVAQLAARVMGETRRVQLPFLRETVAPQPPRLPPS